MIYLDKVNFYKVEKGTRFFRLCGIEYNNAGERHYLANSFNPYEGADFSNPNRAKWSNGNPITGRFSPFEKKPDAAAPVLYAAETKRAAYFEYLIRPRQSNPQFIDEAQLSNLEIATLAGNKPLLLADLREIYFTGSPYVSKAFEYSWDAVFDDELYDAVEFSRALVKEIYEAFPDIDGIAWDSVRLPNVMNMMLFREKTSIDIIDAHNILEEKANWLPDLFLALRNGDINMSIAAKQLLQPSL